MNHRYFKYETGNCVYIIPLRRQGYFRTEPGVSKCLVCFPERPESRSPENCLNDLYDIA